MSFIKVKRKITYEKGYNIKVGELTTKVIQIKKYLFGLPFKTVHKYRKTYYGKIKDYDDCILFV